MLRKSIEPIIIDDGVFASQIGLTQQEWANNYKQNYLNSNLLQFQLSDIFKIDGITKKKIVLKKSPPKIDEEEIRLQN